MSNPQCRKNLGQLEIRALRNSPKGFTMLELMVAIGIFALITGAVLANFRGGERQEELRLAADNVKSILEQARNMILTGQVHARTTLVCSGMGGCGISSKNDVPAGGYGVRIGKDSTGQRFQYQFVAIDFAPGTPEYRNGGTKVVWELATRQGLLGWKPLLDIFPSRLSFTLSPNAPSFTTVTFEPLSGAMIFRETNGRIITMSQQQGIIEATHTALPGQKRSIFLDRASGRISVE